MRSGFCFFAIFMVAVSVSAFAYDWSTNPGDGSPENPYQISEPNHLIAIGSNADLLDKHFILTNDIIFDPNNNPAHVFHTSIIGEIETAGHVFEGTFLGNNKSIRNLKILSQDVGYVGLFSGIGETGTVQDLNLVNVEIEFKYRFHVGGLAGRNEGLIRSCSVNGGITMVADGAGGLVGENSGYIEMCQAEIHIDGDYATYVGGLVGLNEGTIAKSSSKGSIIVAYESTYIEDCLGGFVGVNRGQIAGCYSNVGLMGPIKGVGGFVGDNQGIISACYARGDVEGNYDIGGFAGVAGSESTIAACYSTGIVTGVGEYNDNIGGFAGHNAGTTYLCYWDTQTSGLDESFGGFGKTTAEMKNINTFVGWGYDQVWVIDSGNDYPRLIWENAAGASIQDAPYGYGGGDGTKEFPFIISTPEHLQAICLYRRDFDKHFVLANNIELIPPADPNSYYTNFNVIGTPANPFTGTFNGQYNSILHLHYTIPSQNKYIGLFGCIEATGAVTNLLLLSPCLEGSEFTGAVGAIAGRLTYGEISNCGVQSGKIENPLCAGGIVGENIGGIIIQTFSESSIYGFKKASGPFVGFGGLIGLNENGVIVSCYAKGIMQSRYGGGGLVGQNRNGNIFTSFSVVTPSSGNILWGGIAFSNYEAGSFLSSYWDIETSGVSDGVVNQAPDPTGVTGLTTLQMKQQAGFVGWDFVGEDANGQNEIWRMCADGVDYPRLSWEFAQNGDFACGDGVDVADLLALAESWLLTEAASPTTFNYACDANGDEVIDLEDFGVLAGNW